MNNIAICLLCVTPDNTHINFLNRISGNYTKFMLCDRSTNSLDNTNDQIQYISIDDDICSTSGYRNSNFCIPKNPSAWDKAFYYFCELNNSFDYVWLIEDDVFIPSIHTISYLDQKYNSIDLLSKSNNINTDGSDIDWDMWSQAKYKHPLPWYSSMVCACRISKTLFSKIKYYVDINKTLFFIEIMINTIAMSNNLSIFNPIEFSNIMPKPPIGNRYRKMISNISNSKRYIWVQKNVDNIQSNYLYHPWKEIILHDRYRQ